MSIAIPDPVMLAGIIAPQVNPTGSVSVRETVPAKWFKDPIVMVPVNGWPTFIVEGVLVERVKSWNRNVAVVL